MSLKKFAALVFLALFSISTTALAKAGDKLDASGVMQGWYGLMLELVRHTPTFSPPVASRSFAYIGVTIYEDVASGRSDMRSLAGQLNGLKPVPQREANKKYDEAIIMNAAMDAAAQEFFSNTGPTGQRALAAFGKQMHAKVSASIKRDVAKRSKAYGAALAKHIIAWSKADGGADIQNMGFPLDYKLSSEPGRWLPTSTIGQQQFPLLPQWGNNRPFAMPSGATCPLPPPPAYSEDKSSEFYKQAMEVYLASKNLTPENKTIARFWSDDPMLSTTPPGHWIQIAFSIFERDKLPLEKQANLLARLGVATADAFIGCWHAKYQYDLVRPITYIRKLIDPKFEALLITPPFPEYPSGHSTASAAMADVMTHVLGQNFAFTDSSHVKDALPERQFNSFEAAAQEAGISRLYGGIHFRAAIENGLDQGRCIAAYTNKLQTFK